MTISAIRGWALAAVGGLAITAGCCGAAECGQGGSPPATLTGPAAAETARGRVHVFAINGLDPLCVAGLDRLCGDLRGEGYQNTRWGHFATCHGFAREIRRVREADPCARVVLIGYSYGCTRARSIANALREDGVEIDLLVYIAGDLIEDSPRSRPDNVGRVLSVRSRGMVVLGGDLFFNRDDIDGARNVRLDCGHFSAPSHPETLVAILEELSALAPADR